MCIVDIPSLIIWGVWLITAGEGNKIETNWLD